MPQVLLYPCVHDFNPGWKGGCGPQCEGALHVEVTCLPITRDSNHWGDYCDLRMPERGFDLSDAAMRAYRSMDVVPSLDSSSASVNEEA